MTFFWDQIEFLLINVLLQGETINGDWYCETLKLRWVIQNERRGVLTSGERLFHKTRPHVVQQLQL